MDNDSSRAVGVGGGVEAWSGLNGVQEPFPKGEASEGRVCPSRSVYEEGLGICVAGEAPDETLCKVEDGA